MECVYRYLKVRNEKIQQRRQKKKIRIKKKNTRLQCFEGQIEKSVQRMQSGQVVTAFERSSI